jgi:hypothetical protein
MAKILPPQRPRTAGFPDERNAMPTPEAAALHSTAQPALDADGIFARRAAEARGREPALHATEDA